MAGDRNLRFELIGIPDNSRYLVESPLEISSILGGVMAARSPVSAYCDSAGTPLLTTLIDVNHAARRLVLDCGPGRWINEQALGTGRHVTERLVCVTSLNRVRIQFAGAAPSLTRRQGRDALMLPWPRQLLRLQRREYYRLSTPAADPLECTLRPLSRLAPQQDHVLQIADISAGGFCAHCTEVLSGVEPAARHQVMITLPAGDVLRIAAELRDTFEFTLSSGQMLRRHGWKFLGLQQRERMLIERHVIQQQRLRNSGRRQLS